LENLTVPAVYGQALFEAARDVSKIDLIRDELRELSRVFKETPEFFTLLKMPTASGAQKKEVLKQVLGGQMTAESEHFICVLIDKRRIGSFEGIRTAFERYVDEHNGVTAGRIVSAVPLSEMQIAKFEAETSKLFQKKVKLTQETDASILGGVRIYIDGKLIDASIRTRLDGLKETLFY
jgi:ATP synthase F1 delta subunit